MLHYEGVIRPKRELPREVININIHIEDLPHIYISDILQNLNDMPELKTAHISATFDMEI